MFKPYKCVKCVTPNHTTGYVIVTRAEMSCPGPGVTHYTRKEGRKQTIEINTSLNTFFESRKKSNGI